MKYPASKTHVTARQMAAALRTAWPSAPPVGIELATAHSALETGWWAQCWNWNVGNAKASTDEPHCYFPCGEELQPGYAAELARSPLVTIVGPSKVAGLVSVRFEPEHPMTRFRSFDSLAASVSDHVAMLRHDFPGSWAALATGDPALYCAALKREGYFTAAEAPYAAGVTGCLDMVRRDLKPASDPETFLRELFAPRPFEDPGAFAARCVRALNGIGPGRDSVLEHLAAKVERRASAEQWRTTNCATTMRWIWAWLGCPHPWVYLADEQVRALDPGGPVSWCRRIALDLGALVKLTDPQRQLGEGWGVRYWSGGNNDHMEWVADDNLLDPEADLHCGGGRSGNLFTCSSGDIRFSQGRPAVEGIDPAKMRFRQWDAPAFDGGAEALRHEIASGRAMRWGHDSLASERPTLPAPEE